MSQKLNNTPNSNDKDEGIDDKRFKELFQLKTDLLRIQLEIVNIQLTPDNCAALQQIKRNFLRHLEMKLKGKIQKFENNSDDGGNSST